MDVALSKKGMNLLTYYYEQSNKKSILLLSGLPSLPCKKEVAKLLSSIGFNTILFHYRGTWGSEGFFSPNPKIEIAEFLGSWNDDFINVFSGDFVNIPKPEFALGFSYGGFVSLLSSSLFKKVVAFAPPITLKGEESVFELLKLAGNAYRLNSSSYKVIEIQLKKENFKNALVFHGSKDSIVPFYKNKEFYDSNEVNYIELDADHYPSSYLLSLSIEKINEFFNS